MFEFWLMCIWLLILRWAKTLDITFCADFQLWQLYELLMEQSWEYKIGQIWFSPGPSSGGICMLAVTQLDTSEARMLRSRKLSKYISDALISRNWANSVWVNWKKKLETKMSMSFEIFQIKYLFENKTWCILLCSFRGILFATSLGLFLWCHWRTEKVCAT